MLRNLTQNNQNIQKDDLDDIIEIASRLQQKEERSTQITYEEVEEVAKELAIASEKVKEALTFLENKRTDEKQKAVEQKNQRY